MPTGVALDFSYLDDPSLAHTVAMLWRTAVYVLRGSPANRAGQAGAGTSAGRLPAFGRDADLSGLEVRPVEVRVAEANDPRP